MQHTILKTDSLQMDYNLDGQRISVLKDVDLEFNKGETIAVVGPSGAGKSTLLHILGLLEAPTSGTIYFQDKSCSSHSEQKKADLRLNNFGFVFQFHHLLSEFTAIENVMMPGLIKGQSREDCSEMAGAILSQVGLSERTEHKPGELSGGEQQRVALARALINKPEVILADEPTGNLDLKSAEQMTDLLWDTCQELEATLIVVTHNDTLADRADRTINLIDGKIKI